MLLLADKVVFLTGGTEGIGFECAKAYQRAGASLCIISNDPRSISRAKMELNERTAEFVLADVSSSREVKYAIAHCLKIFGKIDVIHNNAGISNPSKALHETSDEEWHKLFEVNVGGIYNTTFHGIDALKNSSGNILNTGSLVGEIGQEIHAAYTATKGAVNALTKSMALDYAPFGIRVNAVAPAGVITPLLRTWSQQQPDPETAEAYLNNIHALGYCPEGDVVADACLFLISDMARFVTGCILPVSGGAELGYKKLSGKHNHFHDL
ncbi:SDR family oxidoreductase [Dyadobacter chenwenxiniae]|uniref:SDR family oxidoreductase n=1 Tax=Dyadobacter chenwenxiniae TaxID=2906456 RepID=A0A9X1PT13_9BACT|nr:SDR family oxidoreductase [Dyadobacter chenwenxiniae]MCF0064611.1 SDR family oxidoreductase [Dyadobacter chenwenxiniae]UON84331.1 SDR family oxidoreductase [Dyadobacter chenwenxiniae]